MSVTESPAPVVTDPDLEPEEPSLAHIAKREDVAEGYVMGTPITALCGAVFVPSRDPDRYPTCEQCEEIRRVILSGGMN